LSTSSAVDNERALMRDAVAGVARNVHRGRVFVLGRTDRTRTLSKLNESTVHHYNAAELIEQSQS